MTKRFNRIGLFNKQCKSFCTSLNLFPMDLLKNVITVRHIVVPVVLLYIDLTKSFPRSFVWRICFVFVSVKYFFQIWIFFNLDLLYPIVTKAVYIK